jgi:hypothetical protein
MPARIQEMHDINSSGDAGATFSIMLPAAVYQGDYLIVGTNYDPGDCGSVLAVNDTSGNTYTKLIPAAANGGALALETWGAANVARAIQNQVTVTYAGACQSQNVKVVEYTGIATTSAVDNVVSAIGGPGDASPFPTFSTSGPALLFAHTADSTECLSPGMAWNQIVIDGWSTLAEQQIVLEAGTFVADEMPRDDDAWVIQAVALRACH